MKISWLEEFTDAWSARVSGQRVPHALMLIGPAGVGKRAAAAWIARERLGLPGGEDGPVYPAAKPEHADLHWLSAAEDRQTIGVEQVRELGAELALTAYEGHGKVAVIEPANIMTDSAANSLLKTLEEPAGDALLILVTDRIGRLPATVFSRCQRMNVALPAEDRSLDWLRQHDTRTDWRAALALAGGAPLLALAWADRLELAGGMDKDFAGLLDGRGSALELAERWGKLNVDFVLDWLAQRVQRYIRSAFEPETEPGSARPGQTVLRRMDRRNLFCYLDIINGLRSQVPGSFNAALTLESLLIEWSGGLQTCRQTIDPGSLLPGTRTR